MITKINIDIKIIGRFPQVEPIIPILQPGVKLYPIVQIGDQIQSNVEFPIYKLLPRAKITDLLINMAFGYDFLMISN